MTYYTIQQKYTTWREVEVEADNLPEAIAKADEKFSIGDFEDCDDSIEATPDYWYEADNGDVGGLINQNKMGVWVLNDYGNDVENHPLTPCHNATFVHLLCDSETCDVIHEFALCEVCGQKFSEPVAGCDAPVSCDECGATHDSENAEMTISESEQN